MTKKALIRNSTTGLIQFLLTAALTLISIPVFINKLGLELYGVFAIVSVIGNLNLITNLGLNKALVVFVAKQGKSNESDKDIAVAQIILGSLIIIAVCLTILFRKIIINDIFSVPEEHEIQAGLLLVYLVFANALLLLGQAFTSVIDALQKIYLTNISQFIYSIIYWGGMIVVVSLGGDLSSVGIMALVAALIWFLMVYVIYNKLWKKLDLTGLKQDFKKIASKQLSYGSKIYATGLVGFMFEPLSKILISNFIGINVVAFFEIGIKIRGQLYGVLSKILYPLFPFIANSKNDKELKSKIFDLSKKIQLLVIPFVIILGFTLTVLIKYWLGDINLKEISIFTITLSLSMLLFSPPLLPIYQYLMAKNLADKTIWMQLTSVVVNVLVFFVFYKVFDLYAILIANALAFLGAHILGTYYQVKYLNINFRKQVLYYVKIYLYALICTFSCILVRFFIEVSLWDLIIYPSIVLVTFVFYVRWTKLILKSDLDRYFETFPYLKNKLSQLLIVN